MPPRVDRALLVHELLGSEPCGSGYEAGFGAVGHLELCEDRRHVVADGLLAEEECRCDLGVRPPLGEEVQDFELSVGELGEGEARVDRWWRSEESL